VRCRYFAGCSDRVSGACRVFIAAYHFAQAKIVQKQPAYRDVLDKMMVKLCGGFLAGS